MRPASAEKRSSRRAPRTTFAPCAAKSRRGDTTEKLVDAALAGFDKGEAGTLPSVHDIALLTTYEHARAALLGATQVGTPAPRYA